MFSAEKHTAHVTSISVWPSRSYVNAVFLANITSETKWRRRCGHQQTLYRQWMQQALRTRWITSLATIQSATFLLDQWWCPNDSLKLLVKLHWVWINLQCKKAQILSYIMTWTFSFQGSAPRRKIYILFVCILIESRHVIPPLVSQTSSRWTPSAFLLLKLRYHFCFSSQGPKKTFPRLPWDWVSWRITPNTYWPSKCFQCNSFKSNKCLCTFIFARLWILF